MSDKLTMEQVAVLLDAHRFLFMDSAASLGFSMNAATERLERFERATLEDAGYDLDDAEQPP